MNPDQMNPQVMMMLQALQRGSPQMPSDASMPPPATDDRMGTSLGNQPLAQPQFDPRTAFNGFGGSAGPDAYQAMMNPPPMVPPPPPIY